MSLPIHKQYEIVFLSKHLYGPHFGIKKIAKVVKCSRMTVKKWLSRWQIDKYLGDKVRTGRHRTTTKEDDDFIIKSTRNIEEPTSKKIRDHVLNQNLDVSERTIRRRLREAGFRYTTPLSKTLLTLQHQQNRLQWARLVQNQDWSKVVAADETTFRLTSVRHMH
ncbi:unnamed protein product [Rotaria sp. Silwood1]|nr:unnamed protein product [Rotaria sp. Silwood1]CAF3422742.1 unnamed protein product [Rotaria sp. Silwood1]CAF3431548.1 unnamed protein product [Rotaria sp. Silwood1]CAF3882674.1 unnamed protein product [Rotaria sp. Silwood1]CAF4989600.1 unnamed protein product [Rotaria sp. Silwood1]